MPRARRKERPKTWSEFKAKWGECERCALSKSRRSIVLARGTVPCDVLFIGEAPGESEDVLGEPFVGPAGHLLDTIWVEALDAHGDEPSWAMTNVLACMPRIPGDGWTEKYVTGDDIPTEYIEACSERLNDFVHLCDPKIIVLVGKLSGNRVVGQAQFGGKYDPMNPDWDGQDNLIRFVEILHPAF